ncbi:unnamed protein product, partial [Effrenium voratum]
MAQLVVANAAVVPLIQAAMIYAISREYGCYMDLGMAVAVATLLGSDYVKMSLLSHAVGWVPFAGNLIKLTTSLVMTEGMGLAAEKLLSCPESREELMRKASLEENESLTDEKASAVRAIFHATSDFLSNLTSLSTADAAKEIWARIESLLRTEDQVALLQKVSDATSPADLMKLVQQYKWNLPVVEAALGALRDKFPRDLACTDVDVLATRFWGQADGEVKA